MYNLSIIKMRDIIMVILKENGKKYIELTQENLIIYKGIIKNTFVLNEVRAVHMDENNILRILYKNRIQVFKLSNIKGEQKILLRELVERLNREDIVFFSNGQIFPIIICATYFPMILNLLRGSRSILKYLFIILLALVNIAIITLSYDSKKIFIYDYVKQVVKLERGFASRKEWICKEDEYKISYNRVERNYKFKATKSREISIPTNIVYPVYYKSVLNELYENNNNINTN